MPADICDKPCSGPIVVWVTKWMAVFSLYPAIDTKYDQLMRLLKFVVNYTNYLELLNRTFYVITLKPEQGRLVWSNFINASKMSSSVIPKFHHI